MPAAVVAACALLLLAVTRADWLLVLSFALLAFVRVEPAPVDLAFLLLIVVVAVRARRHPLPLPPSILISLLLFAPLTILSMVNANDWNGALRFEAITLYLMALAIFLPTMLDRYGVVRPALKAYILAATASAVLGALALQVGFPGSTTLLYDPQRVQALFKDPNVFGPFLVPALIIVLEDLVRPRLLGWKPRTCALVAILLAVGVLFSYSRAALLNLGLAGLTLFVAYVWRRRGKAAALRLGFAAVVCVITGIGVLAATNSLTFFESRSHLQAYDQNRFATQGAGFREATVHLLGYGPGQVGSNLAYATHNTYARVAYEQGLVGLALILVILVGTLAVALRVTVRDGDVHGLGSAALLASWVGLLANSFFIDTLHWRHLWILAALIWFCAATTRRVHVAGH